MKRPHRRILIVTTLALAWLAIAIFGSPKAWDPIVGEWKESKGQIIEIGVPVASSSSQKALYNFKREDLPEPSFPAVKTKPNDYFPARPFILWSRKMEFFADGTFKLSDADGEYGGGKWARISSPVYRVTEDFLSRQLVSYYTEKELSTLSNLANRRVELCVRVRAYRLEGFPGEVVLNEEKQLAVSGETARFWKPEPSNWGNQAYRQIRIWLGLPVTPVPAPPVHRCSTPPIGPILFPPATSHPVPVPTPSPPPASP